MVSESNSKFRLCLKMNLLCASRVSADTPIIIVFNLSNSGFSSVKSLASFVHPNVSSLGQKI